MWKGYFAKGNDENVKMVFNSLECNPESAIMDGKGSDELGGEFVLYGVIS
jgi:hypothetical protein